MSLRPLFLVIAVILAGTVLFLVGGVAEIELLAGQQCAGAAFCPPQTADFAEDHAVSLVDHRVGLLR